MTFEYFEKTLTPEQVILIPEMLNNRVCNLHPGDVALVDNEALYANQEGALFVDFTYSIQKIERYSDLAEYVPHVLVARTREGVVVICVHQKEDFENGLPTFDVPPESIIERDMSDSEPVVGLIYDKDTLSVFNEWFTEEYGKVVPVLFV